MRKRGVTYYFKTDEQSELLRRQIMDTIKNQRDKEYRKYKREADSKISSEQFCSEKLEIPGSTLRSHIDCQGARVSEPIMIRCYNIYARSDEASMEKFSSIFEAEDEVLEVLEGMKYKSPEKDGITGSKKEIASDKSDRNEDEVEEKAESVALEKNMFDEDENQIEDKNSEMSMNLIEDEVDKYIRSAISEDVDIALDRDEVIYKKYNIKWHREPDELEVPSIIESLYVIPVDKNNVEEIMEKRKETRKKSILWFLYLIKDEKLQKKTEMYLSKCNNPESCTILESLIGDENLYILYKSKEHSLNSYIKDGFCIKKMPIIKHKIKKDGKPTALDWITF